MTLAQVEYLGGIEYKSYDDPEYVTLTGSATIATFKSELKNISVLIDYGMFQGGRDDEQANTTIDERALHTDCIVLTHAHLDHSGRIPLLVKNGYNKPIYMTNLTAEKIYVMLEDYITIMEENRETALNEFKKIRTKANQFLYALDVSKKLSNNNLDKNDKYQITQNLVKFFGENYNLDDICKQAESFLEEHQIYGKKDIEDKYNNLPIVLYDREDLGRTMGLVKKLDYNIQETLNDTYYIDEFSEYTLKKLIKKFFEGYTEKIYVDSSVFGDYQNALDKKIEEVILAEQENILIQEYNQKIEEKYESFVEEIQKILDLLGDVSPQDAPELHIKHKKLLDTYQIHSQEDLDNYIKNQSEPLYDIKYTSKLLKMLKKNLVMRVPTGDEENQDKMKGVRLELLDAGHIEGSAQALFTVVNEKIRRTISGYQRKATVLDRFAKKAVEHKNFLFSGDLGRIKDPNMSGTPSSSPYKLDFLQIESTYAGRNHPNRMDAENEFIETLQNAKNKVIIPAFSMQRTQEVVVLMLETMQNHLEDIEILNDYKGTLLEREKFLNNLEEKDGPLAIRVRQQISRLKKEIHNLKTTSPIFWNIVLDSPLSSKITQIYLNHTQGKYALMDPVVQEKIFGRIVVEELRTKEDQKKLYTKKRANKKEIVVSASGMCTGGAVLEHLEHNLENPKSTIVFVGYCPPNSRGGRIKEKKDVYINGENKEVKCNTVDIKAFSGHLDHEEVLMYIDDLKSNNKLARNATIVLNHGGSKREEIRVDMLESILKTKRNVDVLIPELGDTIEIKC